MRKFLKKVFTIPGVRLPGFSIKIPNWRTPAINLGLPRIGGASMNLRLPSISGLKIVGGVYKVGTLGMLVGVAVTAFAIGTSVVFTQAAPNFPEAGIYSVSSVPLNNTLKVGDEWQFDEYVPAEERQIKSNTLLINMSGARASDISISGIDVGAAWSSTTTAIKIIGATGKVLECDEVILDNITATSLTITDSQFYRFNVLNNQASGISIGGTLSSTPADITVQSERAAVSIPNISSGTFDKIEINTATASSQCKTLTLTGIRGFGGGVTIANLHAGTMTIQNSRFGSDSNIDTTFELTIAATVLYQIGTFTGNTEQPIIVK